MSTAEHIREQWTGRRPEQYDVYDEPHMKKGNYPKLGDLMGITFKPLSGGQVEGIGWYEGSDRIPIHEAAKSLRRLIEAPVLVSDEGKDESEFASDRGWQIYFVAGDQDIDPMLEYVDARPNPDEEDLYDLGHAQHIVYRERKHFDDFDLINYEHRFGEETGKTPMLVYDRKNKRLLLDGGAYSITPRGIEN